MTYPATVLQCPDCSRLIQFAHKDTQVLQCTCGSVLQRKEGTLLSRPYFAILQPADPIQPGTEGEWGSRPFRVLGRFRAWIEEFVWNYWTIAFDDGTLGYLGEGYGLYAFYERTEVERQLTSALLQDIKVGARRDLFQNDAFVLERRYRCYKWDVEGELFLPGSESSFQTFEFAAPDGRHIEILDFGKNVIETCRVTYVSQASLQLTHKRPLEPRTKSITCPQCSKANELKAFPFVQSYACIHCGARYALQDGASFKLLRGRNNTDPVNNISVGVKGVIRGIAYEVIGYALKEENNVGRSQWKEYTLYHPEEGFAFLSEYNGHWIYVREKGDAPVLEKEHLEEFTYDGEPYQLFNNYSFETVNAAGEFPYNIFNDDDKKVKEFISPPEVWIQEKSAREGITWFLGEHIPRRELQNAFGDDISLPYKTGVGAVEPKGYVSPFKIAGVAFVAAVLLVLTHVATTAELRKRVLLDQNIAFPDSASTVSFVSGKFRLDKWRSNLQLDVSAPVDNSWFELNATLVNAQTGTEYGLSQGVEYYHGYSEGEAWSEGGRSETAYLSRIPAGSYYLQVQGIQENKSYGFAYSGFNGISSFHLTVTYDTPNDRNLVVCLIALLLWPLLQYQLVQYQEKSRWSNSPFSPYNSSDND